MRLIAVFLLIPLSFFGQKKKKNFDTKFSAEARANVMKPIGNNTFAKDLNTFAAFGFGAHLMTPINWGIGADINFLFSNVKIGHENIYGNLAAPTFTNADFYILHRDKISEEFWIEEFGGASFYSLKNTIPESHETKSDQSTGFHLGGNIVYTLDREDRQQFVGGIKINYYRNRTFNQNRDIQNYYAQSFFVNLSFGYRYNF